MLQLARFLRQHRGGHANAEHFRDLAKSGFGFPPSAFLRVLGAAFGIVAVTILVTRYTIFEAVFLFPFIMLIPGLAIAEFVLPSADPDELLVISPGVMIAIGGLLSLLDELPSIYSSLSITAATILILFFSAWRFTRSDLVSKISSADKFGLYCMVAAFLLAISVVLLPVREGDVLFLFGQPWHTRMPFLPGDMVLPFRVTQFLANHLDLHTTPFYCCGWQIYDRPPLMGLVAAYLLGVFRINVSAVPVWAMVQQELSGAGFFEFWSAGAFLDALVILSAYLLVKTLFGKGTSRFATLLLVLSPFIFWNVLYTSPKNMAAYFVLFFYYCVITRRFLPLAGVFAGLGVLSHPYVIVYVAGGVLYLIAANHVRHSLKELRKIAIMLAIFLAVVAPWGLWSYAIFHSEPSLFWKNLAGPSDLASMIWARVVNAYRTLTPYFFGYAASDTTSFFSWEPTFAAEIRAHPTLALVGLTYIFTLPGALSLSLTGFSYVGFLERSKSMVKVVLPLVVLPFLLSLVITGSVGAGLAPYFCHPIVVILTAFGVSRLLQHGTLVRTAVSLGLLAESFFVIWVLIYPYRLLLELSSAFDFALLGIVLLCYLVVVLALARVLPVTQQPEIIHSETQQPDLAPS